MGNIWNWPTTGEPGGSSATKLGAGARPMERLVRELYEAAGVPPGRWTLGRRLHHVHWGLRLPHKKGKHEDGLFHWEHELDDPNSDPNSDPSIFSWRYLLRSFTSSLLSLPSLNFDRTNPDF